MKPRTPMCCLKPIFSRGFVSDTNIYYYIYSRHQDILQYYTPHMRPRQSSARLHRHQQAPDGIRVPVENLGANDRGRCKDLSQTLECSHLLLDKAAYWNSFLCNVYWPKIYLRCKKWCWKRTSGSRKRPDSCRVWGHRSQISDLCWWISTNESSSCSSKSWYWQMPGSRLQWVAFGKFQTRRTLDRQDVKTFE